MLFLEITLVACRAIMANKLRMALTLLGIVVGVGSVILLMAYGQGTKTMLLKDFERWGANRMGSYIDRWGSGLRVPATLHYTLEDAAAFREVSYVKYATAVVGVPQQVRRGSTIIDAQDIIGAEPDYQHISNYELESGKWFTNDQNLQQERVCVIGADTKENLFFAAPAVGEFIEIGGKRFEVIGVMVRKGNSRWEKHDERVIVPIHTALSRIEGIDEQWLGVDFSLTEARFSKRAELELTQLLHERHPDAPLPNEEIGQRSPFRFWSAAEWQAESEAVAKSMGTFLLVVGMLSLLIGGVGVMNIMLVSVQERTKEIGLRKAVGASYTTILSQFLLETTLICLLGGAIGTLLAVIASQYMAKLPDEAQVPDPVITPVAILMAVAITLAVALASGLYPAARAASLDPIRAMRFQ